MGARARALARVVLLSALLGSGSLLPRPDAHAADETAAPAELVLLQVGHPLEEALLAELALAGQPVRGVRATHGGSLAGWRAVARPHLEDGAAAVAWLERDRQGVLLSLWFASAGGRGALRTLEEPDPDGAPANLALAIQELLRAPAPRPQRPGPRVGLEWLGGGALVEATGPAWRTGGRVELSGAAGPLQVGGALEGVFGGGAEGSAAARLGRFGLGPVVTLLAPGRIQLGPSLGLLAGARGVGGWGQPEQPPVWQPDVRLQIDLVLAAPLGRGLSLRARVGLEALLSPGQILAPEGDGVRFHSGWLGVRGGVGIGF